MSESNSERIKATYYAALCISIALSIAGQLLMKWAALKTKGDLLAWTALFQLSTALGVYSLGVICWIFALRHVKLSVAYSLSSLNYVGIFLGSYYWFGEQIGALRLLGVTLIFVGAALVVLRVSEGGGTAENLIHKKCEVSR